MGERLYGVENGENAVDSSNVGQIDNAVAKFLIKGEFLAINDQWNGVNQGDLEGYVLCEENDELVYHKINGFGEDSKVDMDTKWLLKEDDRLPSALLNYCVGFDPRTNKELSKEQVEQLISTY